MRSLSTAEFLAVWEQGRTRSPVQRALALLAAACPETPPEALGRLSIGQRDARLLTLREWAFGPKLAGLAACPGCGERLELVFHVADIRVAPKAEPAEVLSLTLADHEVDFRLPNSLDLITLTDHEDLATARQQFLDRCVLAARHRDGERSAGQLPADVVDAVVEQMAQADPQADVQLALTCPDCGHRWHASFDILSFFWSEIQAWACRILRDVHSLASAYGWREADILAMTPLRRQMYQELIDAG